MSDLPDVTATVLSSGRFTEALDAIAVRSLLDDLPAIIPELPPGSVEWRYALLCASALTAASSEAAVEAALQVAQGCLTDSETETEHRRAAAVLLERMGNRRALNLAERRELVPGEAWAGAPAPLQLDVVRRRLELTIPVPGSEPLRANPFQREFWTSVREHRWLSVSAPTSAGKSYIVKRWFEELALTAEQFRGVYLVPTRALIDEVSRELKAHFGGEVGVFVIPWDQEIGSRTKEIFVLTQERLHLLQERDPAFAPEALFIDEAQKFGDGERGVLLQQVLDEAIRRAAQCRVVFASPSAQNPEMLLEGAPVDSRPQSVLSEAVTVNQNLLWVNQTGVSRQWAVELVLRGEPRRVGLIELPARPSTVGKRLALVAVAMGGEVPGNVVYVNGAAEAEKTAMLIADALADRVELSDHPSIAALQELVAKTVHPDYRLGRVLRNGVGFHYGNMPLIIRAEIERLFRDEVLRYLVCTSTLLEGVNLPCRSLFARGPTKGHGRPMTPADFWNLAGRAGRWGTEFRGNVVCVDTSQQVWADVPRARARQPLRRSSDDVLSRLDELRAFIASDSPAEAARKAPLMASVLSFLATRVAHGVALASLQGVTLSPGESEDLEARIRQALSMVHLPRPLFARHAGISPMAMQVLLEYFRGHASPETLPLRLPEAPGSALSYTKALSRSRDYLGADFGTDLRCAMLGNLVRDWMRGHPLRRLIEERARFAQARQPEPVDTARIIRETMDDVEQVARFSAPKYLACYLDVLSAYMGERGQRPEIETETLTMMLELGVSRTTEVSLMALGLSRTSAIALSELIVADDLSPEAALAWLQDAQIEQLMVPQLVRAEIETAVAAKRGR